MPKFRKKPIVIESVQFQDSATAIQAVHEFMGGEETKFNYDDPAKPFVRIPTLEGEIWVSVGDWIIRGVKGELYACKPDIFVATYEPAD